VAFCRRDQLGVSGESSCLNHKPQLSYMAMMSRLLVRRFRFCDSQSSVFSLRVIGGAGNDAELNIEAKGVVLQVLGRARWIALNRERGRLRLHGLGGRRAPEGRPSSPPGAFGPPCKIEPRGWKVLCGSSGFRQPPAST
jgi:hypothetical protein